MANYKKRVSRSVQMEQEVDAQGRRQMVTFSDTMEWLEEETSPPPAEKKSRKRWRNIGITIFLAIISNFLTDGIKKYGWVLEKLQQKAAALMATAPTNYMAQVWQDTHVVILSLLSLG